jgi:hypothetical protein
MSSSLNCELAWKETAHMPFIVEATFSATVFAKSGSCLLGITLTALVLLDELSATEMAPSLRSPSEIEIKQPLL